MTTSLPRNKRICGWPIAALRPALVSLPLLLAWTTSASAASADNKSALIDLAQRFTQAQHNFDVPALSGLTASSYNEVSPLGALDPREKMLGFYAPEYKRPSPDTKLTDLAVQDFGDTGVVVAVLQIGPMPGSPAGSPGRSMRVTLVAHRDGSVWKLVSSQYTPVREQPSGG